MIIGFLPQHHNDNDDNNNKDNDTGIVISIIMNPSGMARPCIKTVIYCHYYQIHILQNIEFLWKKCIDKIGIMPYYMNTRDTCTSTTGKQREVLSVRSEPDSVNH